MRSIYALLLSILSLSPAAAQTASLVRDISTSSQGSSDGSSPESFHGIPGKVFFLAEEPSSGKELWVSDGTGAGTQMLADACPGECSSSPFLLGSAGGTLFFEVRSGPVGELWRSDGTRAGTFSLTPLENGVVYRGGVMTLGASPYLLFAGCPPSGTCDLWRTDGTVQGTRLVKNLDDFFAGMMAAEGKVFFSLQDFSGLQLWVTDGTEAGTVPLGTFEGASLDGALIAGGRLFFLSSTPQTGYELWASDGTVPGTRRLTDFPGERAFLPVENSLESYLRSAGNRLYFLADDSVHGVELWRSDGTVSGTRRLTDFDYPQPFPLSFGLQVEEVKDRAVFMATDGVTLHKVWTSTGDPKSVTPLPDPCGGACGLLPEFPWLVRAGDRVFYSANDGLHGFEVWATDGTPAGTRMLQDVCPGKCNGILSPAYLRAVGDKALFIGERMPFEPELFLSDGTSGGTKQVTSFGGHGGLFQLEATISGDRIFFAASDKRGAELWVSEGGASQLVADINRDEPSTYLESLTAHGGQLFFSAITDWMDLWRSDGTFEGTVPVTSSDEPFSRSELTSAGSWLFYVQSHDFGEALWRTDGNAAGTILLFQSDTLGEIEGFQGRAIFTSISASFERWEFWSSDGTHPGTVKAFDLPAGHFPFGLKALGNDLYFLTDSDDGWHLWRWPGTSGPAELADVSSGFSEIDPQFTRVGSRVFFAAANQLWVTDGSSQGTRQLSGEDDPWVSGIAALGSHLYFLDIEGSALGRSDGTVAGTAYFKTLPTDGPQPHTSDRPELFAAGSHLYFLVSDAAHGKELWTSDGTAAGTMLLRDVNPGAASSDPAQLTPVGDRLFFSAGERIHGIELWQTDGTEAGTRLVQDIAPQGFSSNPLEITPVGDRLFFTAADQLSGRELWSLPLAAPGCQASPTRLCLNNGRFQVEAVWRDFQGNAGKGTAVALTPDTGYFWFFDPSNVETIVKVLNGQGVNGHHWVFYGALSTVDYTLTVTDTQTGLTRRYHNPAGQLASVGDTTSFGPLGAFSRTPAPAVLAAERIDPPPAGTAGAPCQASDERLCLQNGRFAVEVAWKDFQGNAGKGKAVNLTPETGYFWFFDSANVEVVLKVLDGTSLNGKHWVFYGALSSVEYKITVTDTLTGKVKVYENPSGRLASVADTSAF